MAADQIYHPAASALATIINALTMMAIGRIFYSDFGLFDQVPIEPGSFVFHNKHN